MIGLGILHQLQGRTPQAFGLRQFARDARRLQLPMKTEHQVARAGRFHFPLADHRRRRDQRHGRRQASQTQEKTPLIKKRECGTVIPPGQLRSELDREAVAAPDVDPPTDAPYYVPLTIHIVRRSNGTGGFTLGQYDIAMRDLNQMWQPVGMQFFIYRGIDFINDDTHFIVPDVTATASQCCSEYN